MSADGAPPRSPAQLAALLAAMPYARHLGLSLQHEDEALVLRLPFRDDLVGNPSLRALHGGAMGALMECAAVFQLMAGADPSVVPRPVSINIEYLRGPQPVDTFARASITRRGRRVASVRVIVYQADPDKPVAAASLQVLLAVPRDCP
ncbi:MAG: PaaI family thioesterase [Panacagrimonas sp.]